MKQEDAEEYTQSLGQIVAGSWRQIAWAKRNGVPQALGLSVDDWVNQRLGGYVKYSIADRRMEVAKVKAENPEYSTRDIADVLGASKSQIARDLAVPNGTDATSPDTVDADDAVPNGTPIDTVAALAADSKIRSTAQATETRRANLEKQKAELYEPVADLPEGLIVGDFREKHHNIPDESVELVFTDPPYDRESVLMYGDAAAVAARILKPGGSFIAYCGQYLLPDVLANCERYLTYFWTLACLHDGDEGKARMTEYGIIVDWKPMVWFVKGDFRGDREVFVHDSVAGTREKSHHPWQQSQAQAAYYIDKLTPPDGTVVDFFLGGGTTAAAAAALGRRWIGYEIDAAQIAKITDRLRSKAA